MLAHASLHDAAEVLCSDVVTPVKKANAVLQREFERLEKAAEDKLIQTLPEELRMQFPEPLLPVAMNNHWLRPVIPTPLTSSANLRWPQVMALSSKMLSAKWNVLLLR